MKKIYLSLLTAFICGSVVAQNAFNAPKPTGEQVQLSPTNKFVPYRDTKVRASGPFSLWVETIGDIMTNKGLDLNSQNASADQALYLGAVYMDSTTMISSPTSTRFISQHFYGTVLDPKSTYLQSSFDPIVSKADAYTLDSLTLLGSYVKVTSTVDTLMVSLVWGDTNSTDWKKTSNVWNSPIGGWRSSLIGPAVQGFGAANGNIVSVSAATNKVVIKYPLAASDSSQPGYLKYITIPLSAAINIPADNILSCIVTFVPGATPTLGDVSYAFPGAPSTQNVNGFGLAVWNQKTPTVAAITDYLDHQVDNSSMSMGVLYQKGQRYATAGWNGYHDAVLGYLVSAPVILYKISGTSTVGVNELNSNLFSLSQNNPNPFNGTSKINYSLKNDAQNVSFAIYDVRGAKVFESKELNSAKGAYSIELSNQSFNSGLYFYTLTVDGHSVTKKMIVTK